METAAMKPSAVLWLTLNLLATGLRIYNGDENKELGDKFAKMLHGKLNMKALSKYGIKPVWLKYQDDPKTTQAFAKELRKVIRTKISEDVDVGAEELKALKFAYMFMADPFKNNYLDRARRWAATISPKFSRNFEKVIKKDAVKSASDVVANFKALSVELSDITGRKYPNGVVPAADKKAISDESEKGAELVKAYNKASRALRAQYLLDMAQYLVSAKDNIAPVKDVYTHMSKVYPVSYILRAKKDYPLQVGIDEGKIRYYTEDGEPLVGAIPANISQVKFYNNDDSVKAYMVYKTPQAVGPTSIYTESHKQNAQKKKFELVDTNNASIDKTLRQWTKDLTAADPMKRMTATVCYILYKTSARIGVRQHRAASNSGKPTYGIISLRARHVTVDASKITIQYIGKKEGKQKHIIKMDDKFTKQVGKTLKELQEGKTGKDDDTLLFAIKKRNKWKHVTPDRVADYLRATGFVGGAHKIRHIRGTELTMKLIETKKWKPSVKATTLAARQKEGELFIQKNVLEPVGKLLGHFTGDKVTWRTAMSNYINPRVVAEWFEKHELKQPNWVPKVAK